MAGGDLGGQPLSPIVPLHTLDAALPRRRRLALVLFSLKRKKNETSGSLGWWQEAACQPHPGALWTASLSGNFRLPGGQCAATSVAKTGLLGMGQEAWPLWVGSELFACLAHPNLSATPGLCHLW